MCTPYHFLPRGKLLSKRITVFSYLVSGQTNFQIGKLIEGKTIFISLHFCSKVVFTQNVPIYNLSDT